MREIYLYVFNSVDENGETGESISNITKDYQEDVTIDRIRQYIASFLQQTNEAYVDKYGIIHEIYDGIDQPVSYIFEIIDKDWSVLEEIISGYLNENEDMTESVKSALTKVYNYVYKLLW